LTFSSDLLMAVYPPGSLDDWTPGFVFPESIEAAALKLAKIHGPQAVLGRLLDQQRLGIEWAVIWKIRSLLMPGRFEVSPRA
jgi:hypothetical protein